MELLGPSWRKVAPPSGGSGTGTPRHSLIIPAYNEQAYLPRLLDSVDRARARYRGGPEAVEVIVSDNASTDATAGLAAARGCRLVSVERRGIAVTRNAGARAAWGEVLSFVDADHQVHPDTFDEIDRVLTDRVIGGTTGIRFERRSAGIACTYLLLLAVAVAIRGIRHRRDFALDTGVVFCRRRDFEAVGGYREDMLYAEDIRLLLDLRKLGRLDGRILTRGTRTPSIFSTRKFDTWGDWHYFTMPVRIGLEQLRRRSDTARRYWYDVRPGA
jgi:glycosyltransferase involved in cell wall biosynthesis